jgi:histidyl-tRNA synthetase
MNFPYLLYVKIFLSSDSGSKMKNIITSVKGTREFYPREMALRNWLYSQINKVSELYGYQEYDGPFLESIELYAAKSGEEIVKEQSFVFPDRGGNLIALRPELTPSLARMVAQRQNDLVFPLRWWSFGPFWRYERPQKGRTREFFQWNIDLFGVNTPEADAELVSISANLFANLGLKPNQIKILVNDRRLMDAELSRLGFSDSIKPAILKMIDRRDKLPAETWEKFVLENGVSPEQLISLKEILGNSQLFQNYPDLMRFFNAVKLLGFEEYVEYDPGIVRGLDYYTGIVFEARDIGSEGRAILGGGHYDNLVADVGGNPLPGTGFAMGDVVLPLVLEGYGLIPKLDSPSMDVLVAVFDKSLFGLSIQLAAELRKAGIRAANYPESTKLDKQLKYANRAGLRWVLIIGPDEIANNEVNLKDLKTGNQEKLKRVKLIGELQQRLLAGS